MKVELSVSRPIRLRTEENRVLEDRKWLREKKERKGGEKREDDFLKQTGVDVIDTESILYFVS